MECMEARALKSSFSSEIDVKNVNNQGICEDLWGDAGLPCDDFSIDQFFDLPNEDNFNCDKIGASLMEEEEEEDEEKDSNSSSSLSSSHDPFADSAHFSTHLAIPDDDMQELELWSHLMDDSVPEPTLACPRPTTVGQNNGTGFGYMNRAEPYVKQGVVRVSVFPTAVPVKPRSKRPRAVLNRTWFTGSPPKAESSSSSSPPSPVSTLWFTQPGYEMGMCFPFGKPPLKKQKKEKRPVLFENGETGLNPPVQRRCSHCQVTKTPQWRAGPNGPKTLCNACGVRFKSGRLFPEYRPACSPTFSSEVHSNSHRKVLEMRRKKETTEPFTGLVEPVSSS
ncbi:GATA transcription factor 5-like [Silene latifolia]|uniref:GATA transcription factor 5-like n=1 Tax=Silene latifolia TaxID=37657 RepID=UPI003D77F3A4